MKKIWKKGMNMFLAGGLSVMCMAGCGKDASGSPEVPAQEIQQDNVEGGAQINKGNDATLQQGGDNNAADSGAAGSPEMPAQEIQQDNVVGGAQVNKETGATLQQGGDNNAADSRGDGEFFNGANLQGDVVEFSETGFTLSPASTEEDGKVLAQTIPGLGSDENNIQVTYTDNTVFQIVNFSSSLQSEVSREDTDKGSVKKQTSVAVFGSCQDTYHWTADKILILRWQ